MVINRLTGNGVVAVTFGFCTERTNHLRVTVIAAFAYVNITTGHLQSVIRFHTLNRLGYSLGEEQRHGFNQQTYADYKQGKYNQDADFFFS